MLPEEISDQQRRPLKEDNELFFPPQRVILSRLNVVLSVKGSSYNHPFVYLFRAMLYPYLPACLTVSNFGQLDTASIEYLCLDTTV